MTVRQMLFLYALLLGVAIWYAALHLAYPKAFAALFLFGLAVLHVRLRRQYPEDAYHFELPVYGYLLGLYLTFFWALLMALAFASLYPDGALLLVLPSLAYPLALHHLTATRTWLDKIHFGEHLEKEEVPLRFWQAMGATGELYSSSVPMRDGPYHATPPFFPHPVIIAARRQDPYVAYYAHFVERRYGYTRFEFFIRLLPTALALWFFWNQTHSFSLEVFLAEENRKAALQSVYLWIGAVWLELWVARQVHEAKWLYARQANHTSDASPRQTALQRATSFQKLIIQTFPPLPSRYYLQDSPERHLSRLQDTGQRNRPRVKLKDLPSPKEGHAPRLPDRGQRYIPG
ncbi:MAG: hypothetical protein KM310_11465 [Clostridiales bacterium]|nr:hypothetical protein [Clostridiales bacterium]